MKQRLLKTLGITECTKPNIKRSSVMKRISKKKDAILNNSNEDESNDELLKKTDSKNFFMFSNSTIKHEPIKLAFTLQSTVNLGIAHKFDV